MLHKVVKPEFKQVLDYLKSQAGYDAPRVKFSPEVRAKLSDIGDVLDHFEAMLTLLELHSFWPFASDLSLESNALDIRRALAYEIILRQLGHGRSLIANTNVFNHVGTGTAVRCMLEIHAFVVYLKDPKVREDTKFLFKLLNGRLFTSGDWHEIDASWTAETGQPIPEEIKDYLERSLKTPHVGKYLKHFKEQDKGFDALYAFYSDLVHPTFERTRALFIANGGYQVNEYFDAAQKQPSPVNMLKRDVDAGDFCLELFWPEVFSLDPIFDERWRNQIMERLISEGLITQKDLGPFWQK